MITSHQLCIEILRKSLIKRLLSLSPDDLAVTRYYAEVKLKCGLYLYIDGDDDNKYGRAPCSFFGKKRAIKVNKKSVKDVEPQNWVTFYYDDASKKCDKKDPKYPKIKEIAKIVENSTAITFKSAMYYID